MKLLGLFFVAAVCLQLQLQLQVEGRVSRMPSQDSNQLINKRSQFSSEEDSEGIIDASTKLKFSLKVSFAMPEWRHLIIMKATPEDMADPEFRNKWKIKSKDVKRKEEETQQQTPEQHERRRKFFNSRKWKGMVVLSSSKAELTNSKYRKDYGLGAMSEEVKNSSENGNFFEGPQWREFLTLTGLVANDGTDDRVKVKVIMNWMSVAGHEIDTLFFRRRV